VIDILEKVKGWLSLGVGPLLVLMLFTGLISFLPSDMIASLGLSEIKMTYGEYFGLAFIYSIAAILVASITKLWDVFLGNWIKEKVTLYFYRKEAYDLTDEEREILRLFINGKTRSAHLSLKNGTVLGLERRMFIVRVGQLGTDAITMTFPFNIQPWAWEYLNKNPHLLDRLDNDESDSGVT
jgi:hypothetical protein